MKSLAQPRWVLGTGTASPSPKQLERVSQSGTSCLSFQGGAGTQNQLKVSHEAQFPGFHRCPEPPVLLSQRPGQHAARTLTQKGLPASMASAPATALRSQSVGPQCGQRGSQQAL